MSKEQVPLDQATILIVDDDVAVRDLAMVSLTTVGYRCMAAEGVDQASEILANEATRIDAVLTDITMPGKTGFDLAVHVRELDEEMPLIFMTGFADLEKARTAVKLGAHDFLLKPMEVQELRLVVGRAVERRRLRRENQAFRTELENRYFELRRLENQKALYASLVVDDMWPVLKSLRHTAQQLKSIGDTLGTGPAALCRRMVEQTENAEDTLRLLASARSLDPATLKGEEWRDEHVDIRGLVEDVARETSLSREGRGGRLKVSLPDDPESLTVRGDTWLVRRMLNALAEVAMRRSRDEDDVLLLAMRVTTQRAAGDQKDDGRRVAVAVRDQGAVIPVELREQILSGMSPEEIRANGIPLEVAMALRFVNLTAQELGATFVINDGPDGKGMDYTLSLRRPPADASSGLE